MELVQLIWKISWQTAVVAAVIWAITRLAGKAPAAWRHALWLVVLIKFFVPPFVHAPAGWAFRAEEPVLTAVTASRPGSPSTYLSSFRNDALPYEKHAEQALPDIRPGSDRSAKFFSYTPSDPTVEDMVSKETGGGAHLSWIAAIWLAGVLIGSAVLVLRYVRQRRLIKCSTIAGGDAADLLDECASRLGVRRLPQMRVSEQAPTPMLVGLLRPTILLPPGIGESCSRADMTAMLMHELAHIRRWDMVGVWLYQLARVLFFFHPALWLAGHEMRREREIACDELVLSASGIRPEDYASGYVSALKMANGLARVATSLAMAEPFEVEQRRVRLMLRAVMPRFTLRWAIALAVVMLVGIPTFIGCRSSAEARTTITDDGFVLEYKNPPTWKWKDLTFAVKSIGSSNYPDEQRSDSSDGGAFPGMTLECEFRSPSDRWSCACDSGFAVTVRDGKQLKHLHSVSMGRADMIEEIRLDSALPSKGTRSISLHGSVVEVTPQEDAVKGPFPIDDTRRPLRFADKGLTIVTTDWKVCDRPYTNSKDLDSVPAGARIMSFKVIRLEAGRSGGAYPHDFVLYDSRGRSVQCAELDRSDSRVWPWDDWTGESFCYPQMQVVDGARRAVHSLEYNKSAYPMKLSMWSKGRKLDLDYCPSPALDSPMWSLTSQEARNAVRLLSRQCEPEKNAHLSQTFVYSVGSLPPDFVPAKVSMKVLTGGSIVREVKFSIKDIPIPDEFWKQMDK